MEPSNYLIRGELKYRTGQAFDPVAGGHRLVLNFCQEDYGSSYNKDITKKWAKVEQEFKLWRQTQLNFKTGKIKEARVQSDLVVLNILMPSLDLNVLASVLKDVVAVSEDYGGSSVHISASNLGLTEENKNQIEDLITKILRKKGIHTTIYT